MTKRSLKSKGKIEIRWSPDFAYATGLIATDGCVYSNKDIVNLTSKDLEQILHIKMALKLENVISVKSRAKEQVKKYYLIQFGDADFVLFLKSIGIGPAKSKTIKSVKVPDAFFYDFFRGCFDGDGTFYSYWDKRWRSSFMFYLAFASASRSFIDWLRDSICNDLGALGHITSNKDDTCWQLKYAKKESEKIIRRMYPSDKAFHLSRKRLKINRAFAMMGMSRV